MAIRSLALHGWESTAGENSRTAKFTNEQVREIPKLNGIVTTRELADKYGVTTQAIRDIWSRRRYASVKDECQ